MTDEELKALCLRLMRADTEDEVVAALAEVGLWDDPDNWRCYGDDPGNFSQVGNQQSDPHAALVEKLVNSVDARLLYECLKRGVDPTSADAPATMTEAVARFYGGSSKGAHSAQGYLKNWTSSEITSVSRGITVAATGARSRPSFTIADCGEGQTPRTLPDTILSLHRQNKRRIPFVQGKFNMGGTGVLKFCGIRNLQLVVSKKAPGLVTTLPPNPTDHHWAFTVVRREQTGMLNSVFTYLAPIPSSNGAQRGVLSFPAEEIEIFPEGRSAYARKSNFGTLIKLYEYNISGKSHILLEDGLYHQVNILLPRVALPIRFYECRDYRGHAGSFETPLTGLVTRLESDRTDNLEPRYPFTSVLRIEGEVLTASVYLLKENQAKKYRRREGILFEINGQTHAIFPIEFFRRKNVGLSYLAESLLLTVDCTNLAQRTREDLFQNSRDRMARNEFRAKLERELETLLKESDDLRRMRAERQQKAIESRLANEKPLEESLRHILARSPALSSLFLHGDRAVNPFRPKTVASEESEYEGRTFPTYFRFKGKAQGGKLQRECHLNSRFRIAFETDAENSYFDRSLEPGRFGLHFRLRDGSFAPSSDFIINLQNGIANLTGSQPKGASVGNRLQFRAEVSDTAHAEAFTNEFDLTVTPAVSQPGKRGSRRKPPSEKEGDDRDVSSGISLPRIIPVTEDKYADHGFDKYTALSIVNSGEGTEDTVVYDFFVNIDNVYLKNEQKGGKANARVLRAQFTYGVVLIGLSLLHQYQHQLETRRGEGNDQNSGEESDIETTVRDVTKALSPVILPIIRDLADLDEDLELVEQAVSW